jgi:galactitol-specific phosphotransferase system IIB component
MLKQTKQYFTGYRFDSYIDDNDTIKKCLNCDIPEECIDCLAKTSIRVRRKNIADLTILDYIFIKYWLKKGYSEQEITKKFKLLSTETLKSFMRKTEMYIKLDKMQHDKCTKKEMAIALFCTTQNVSKVLKRKEKFYEKNTSRHRNFLRTGLKKLYSNEIR